MKNKRGISLIVLVITIIIIIILAGAVILNLTNNNPIENASEAKIASDLDAFKSDLTIQIGQKYLENIMLNNEQIDSDETKEGWHLIDLVPSIKGTEYEKHLVVENGELKLRIDSTLDESTKEIIEKNLGKAVLTASMIIENPKEYIGKSVTYTGYSENTNTIDWRLFGLDENGNIMLRANDYVDLNYKKYKAISGVIIDGYSIYSDINRDTLINYIGTPKNWTEYSISGKTEARGAMTLPEFANGYNLVNDEKLEVDFLTKGVASTDSALIASIDGYVIRKKDGQYNWTVNDLMKEYNGINYYIPEINKAHYYRIASASANYTSVVMLIDYNGYVAINHYDYNYGGLCPVVSLTTANLVQNADGNFVVE